MAFTHTQPFADRNYQTAYSVNTDGTFPGTGYLAREVSNQFTNSTRTFGSYTSSSRTFDGTKLNVSSTREVSNVANYSSVITQEDGDNKTTIVNSSAAFLVTDSRNFSRTEAQTENQITGGSTTARTFLGGTSNTTLSEIERSTALYARTDVSGSGTYSSSLFNTSRLDRQTATYILSTSVYSSSSSTSLAYTIRDGSSFTSSSSSSSTRSSYRFTGGDPDSPPFVTQGGDSNEDIGAEATGNITEETQQISTQSTTIEGIYYATPITTTNSYISYTKISTDLDTISSSYEITTSILDYTTPSFINQTRDIISRETITLTNYTNTVHSEYSALGGAFYLTGGSSLLNGYGVGLGTNTTTSDAIAVSNFQSYSYSGYLSNSIERPTVTISEIVETINSDSISSLLTTSLSSSEGTRIVETTQSLESSGNFGTYSVGNIFTTQTFSSYFDETYLTSSIFISTIGETVYISGSTLINTSVQTTSIFTSSYVGSEGLGTYTYTRLTSSIGIAPTLFNVNSQSGTRYDDRWTIYTIDPALYTSTYGWGFNNFITKDILSYDKGSEGGVQYSTSSDISGAIRGYQNVSVADARLTTVLTEYEVTLTTESTTTISSNDSIFSTSTTASTNSFNPLTINTSSSGSYESAGLPLGFVARLNRYAEYLPASFYGSVYYNAFGDIAGSNQVDLSPVEDGLSDIKYHKDFTFSSTFEVVTSDTDAEESNITTIANIKTAHTTLYGRIEIEEATDDDNYHRTRLRRRNYNTINAHGGYLFTDREGVIINRGLPTTLYAFGSTGSSSITQALTEMGDGTNLASNTLPANSMIFIHETSIPVTAFVGNITFDRKQ